MYRNFIQGYRETIPSGLPARLADPDLMAAGKPMFLRIGEGNEPRNELLRIVNRYPSQDEVRTKVLGDVFARNPEDKYDIFTKPNNIAALRTASQELGIPLESIGFKLETNPFRLEGQLASNPSAIEAARTLVGRVASTQAKQDKPYVYNYLKRTADFYSQPRSTREIAAQGSEGIDSIMAAVELAEPTVRGTQSGNRPILLQAEGLDPNVGIPTGRPQNIPPMDIEGLSGPRKWDEIIPRQRFIDTGAGIFTRSGEPITKEQKALLDTGMADLEDRSFILRDPVSANQVFTTQRKELGPLMSTYRVPLPTTEQYRPTTRLGMEVLGLNANIGRETTTPAVVKGDVLYPSNTTIVRRSIPITRLSEDLSNRVISGEVDLRNYEPFKSNPNTYGISQSKTPWREYYSDPFVYEDTSQDKEVSRLMNAIESAPRRLEEALTQQAMANRRASDIQGAINAVRRMGKSTSTPQGDVFSLGVNPELVTPLLKFLKNNRRIAEVEASKAQDTIAQLRAAQDLLGVEYMVKPKPWGEEVLSGYRIAARDKGAMKDGGYYEQSPTTDSLSQWRTAISNLADNFANDRFDNRSSSIDRDYDIASAFGFTGNY